MGLLLCWGGFPGGTTLCRSGYWYGKAHGSRAEHPSGARMSLWPPCGVPALRVLWGETSPPALCSVFSREHLAIGLQCILQSCHCLPAGQTTRRRVGSGSGVPPCPPHPMLGCLWAVCSRDLLSGCSPPRLEMFPPRVLAGSCELPLPAVLGDGWWLLGLRWLMGTRAQSSAWGGGAGWLWWDRASCAEHRVLPAFPGPYNPFRASFFLCSTAAFSVTPFENCWHVSFQPF